MPLSGAPEGAAYSLTLGLAENAPLPILPERQ